MHSALMHCILSCFQFSDYKSSTNELRFLWPSAPTFNDERRDSVSRRRESRRKARWKLTRQRRRGGVQNGMGVPLASRLGVWVKSSSEAAEAFGWFFSCEDASDSSNFHHFSAGKKWYNSSRGNCPVVPRVPWHFDKLLSLCSRRLFVRYL